MAELATLARPYAKAVFEMAKSQRRLDPWGQMLDLLAAVTREEAVVRMLDSAELSDPEKARRLVALCADDLDDRGRALVDLLAANKRLEVIGELRDQFDALKAQEQQVLDVEIVSAYELTDEQTRTLRDALQGKFQRDVNVTSRVEPSLVGGALIRAGDTVIDGSVRGKLERLAEALQRI